jgi:hypothetical protein
MQIKSAHIYIDEHHSTGSVDLRAGENSISLALPVEAIAEIAEIAGIVSKYSARVLNNVAGVSGADIADSTALELNTFIRSRNFDAPEQLLLSVNADA